jgi:hypothetical protein
VLLSTLLNTALSTPSSLLHLASVITMSAQAPPSSTGSTKLDAIKANMAAASPAAPKGLDLYSRFAFAGAVCCAVTHGGFTPVDVYVFSADGAPGRAPMASLRAAPACRDHR